MRAFVESYEDGKSIIKICGDDDEVLERFEVTALILESRAPVCFRTIPDVTIRFDITRN
ncbi:MAG: hypothetical protein A4E60_00975 [Syntrophorhabdus sp. PtaB.Bin047]|jgi:hypothetical protein|nr:MAG: hypothetical protein A4E60_00975 [Syntrophorhabdus sp. PtaB.Bin047]